MKVCLLEFWGLGDAVMMTPMLQALRYAGITATVACKPGTIELLQPSYPEVEYLPFDPPWTVFRGKYRLWRWPWRRILRFCFLLRRKKFDAVVSVRRDPRDHLLMLLSGAKRRLGLPSILSRWTLTDALPEPADRRPIPADWQALQSRLLPSQPTSAPRLVPAAYGPPHPPPKARPIIGLHAGARIHVRRWDEKNFRDLFRRLRERYEFDFMLMPDIDGYGRNLRDLADVVAADLSLPEMVGAISRCDLLICNDSAPGHVADALGVPVITIFGPTDPIRFRPFSAQNLVVIRDICPFRPCFDYCRFSEPKCLTQLAVSEIWNEVQTHIDGLLDAAALPPELRRQP